MAKFHNKNRMKKAAHRKTGNKKKRGFTAQKPTRLISNESGTPKLGSDVKISKKHRRRISDRTFAHTKAQNLNNTLSSQLLNAEKRGDDFLLAHCSKQQGKKPVLNENFKKCFKEFKKVVDAADVIIEVLDARDPLGSRCEQVEQSVLRSSQKKRLILLINKIDLIPQENLEKWIKYLRQEFPTVAFKASTQSQKENLAHSKVAAIHVSDTLKASSRCIGAKFLMKVLGNYCRNENILTSIRVGVVGYPNVGKSSVINSLKRCHACDVGATPGITKTMQEIHLDKHIRLLDCPGVVFGKDGSESSLALRNALKVETLDDVMTPAEAVIQRVDHKQLIDHYQIPPFTSNEQLLHMLAKKLGRYRKGGIPDVDAAALKLINDWNCGIIKYYTHPPEAYAPFVHIGAEVVQEMSQAFDISALMDETELQEMQSEEHSDAAEVMDVPQKNSEEELCMEDEFLKQQNLRDKKSLPSVSVKFRSKKKNDCRKDADDVNVLKLQKNKQRKKVFKQMKKKRRRMGKVASDLSEAVVSSLNLLDS